MLKGLTNEEVKINQQTFGKNIFNNEKKKNPFLIILTQFANPLILLLLIAAFISYKTGEPLDAIIILAVIVINTIVGFIQEFKAEKAIEALKKISSPSAIVIRDGQQIEILASELTIGDYVILEAGGIVPADIQLLENQSILIDESALTGESVAVEKDCIEDENVKKITNKKNYCFMSTFVTFGRAEGVVKSIGEHTAIGKIATLLKNIKDKKTPLQKNLSKLSFVLGFCGILLCIAMFGFGYFIQHKDLIETLLLAISIAVAVIPEGLATIVTIVLAIGINKMVQQNAIVKKLPAIETIGAVNVVCSDKTGTLTQNKMTVQESYSNGEYFETDYVSLKNMLANGFILCNDATISENGNLGDPTEIALLAFAEKNKYNISDLKMKYKRIAVLPFDSDRKMMTTLHSFNNTTISFTKGAIDNILKISNKIYINGKAVPFTDDMKEKVLIRANNMAEKALRVLSIAFKIGDTTPQEKDLIFIGFVGMIDPPKEGVKETIFEAKNAGINIVMITGDHKITAFAIAKQLDICQSIEGCLSGDEIDQMDKATFAENILKYNVFARVSPEQKVLIIEAFQNKNKVVSMTGDGVNDAPALKKADIGIAMGKGGTDVAKNSADIILVDDNFITIIEAIKEGRNLFKNIKKSITYLLRANFGEIVAIAGIIFAGFAAPLSTIQILWVNLITDSVPALALGMDKSTNEVMKEQPRNIKEGLLNKRDYKSIVSNGFICGISTIIAYFIPLILTGTSFLSFRETPDPDVLLLCQTFAFSTLVLSELFMVYVSKAYNKTIFSEGIFNNKILNISVVFGIILQLVITSVPFISSILKISTLSINHWLYIVTCAMLPVFISEVKYLFKEKK